MAPTLPTLPDVTSLPTLPDAQLTAILDLLFEPSDDLHTLALPTLRAITFASYPELADTIRDQLLVIAQSIHADANARKPLHSILGSHPRLGEKKVHSSQSAAEQAQLRAGAGAEDEAERLAALNREYEATFPGLRYVVFVNGRGRDIIMEDMRKRIDRANLEEEEKEAIAAMADIAKDRASKLKKESDESTVGRSALPAES
ncbi:Oxo-4-hydroxy-4-carboxy-5-ureidoimidazoline decarboxylase [Diaporthe sp. PMI_573]|nr:Oxo-4-hydroxy-4-carboxy-5-ureidoimidazoline decarboxylase [Diaporthaceae sp. PMI_573]